MIGNVTTLGKKLFPGKSQSTNTQSSGLKLKQLDRDVVSFGHSVRVEVKPIEPQLNAYNEVIELLNNEPALTKNDRFQTFLNTFKTGLTQAETDNAKKYSVKAQEDLEDSNDILRTVVEPRMEEILGHDKSFEIYSKMAEIFESHDMDKQTRHSYGRAIHAAKNSSESSTNLIGIFNNFASYLADTGHDTEAQRYRYSATKITHNL